VIYYPPKEKSKMKTAEIEQYITLETDPMAKERIKLLPRQIYLEIMQGYEGWRKQIAEIISPSGMLRIAGRYQGSAAEKQAVYPYCPYSQQ
jgi:hypothetical protein